MKRRLFQGLLILALLCGAVLLAHPTAAWALAGSGTQDEPYRITTEADLQEFAERVNGGQTTACAVLMTDIKLNGTESDPWTPIGTNYNNRYTGTFDGRGRTISGLYIDSNASYVGLFGYIGTNGMVKNLNLADSYINSSSSTGTDTCVGGICGVNWGSITTCSNSGTVTGSDRVGGICGYNWGNITSCSNSGLITGNGAVGGICGLNTAGRITSCSNSGPVTGNGDVGGICGRNTASSITTCSNSGTVTCSGTYAGGICGQNWSGSITNCSNSGIVTGSGNYLGGICGYGGGITTCYWLEGTAGAGIGDNSGGGEATEKTAAQFASGEVAWLLNGSSTNGPWRQNLSGPDKDVFPTLDPTHGVVGSLGNGAYHNCTYNDTGFCTICGSYEPAVQDASGTYQINNAGQLYWFAGLVNGGQTTANAVLTKNITINSNVLDDNGNLNESAATTFTQWTPIGDSSKPYVGTFDGAGHTISGLYIDSNAKYVGLFGRISTNGTVKNLTLADSSINSSSSGDCAYVGGICGYNWGSITNCHNSGSVAYTGSGAEDGNEVGGICGWNDGSITTCSNSGKVVSNGNTSNGNTSDVGGICGLNFWQQGGSIENCSNSGDVSVSGVNAYSGGICGYNWSSITTCSNSGKVTGSTGSGSRNSVGGVCGWNYAGFITNCGNSGEVSGNSVGGICGVNDGGSITNCSNSGDVSGSGDSSTVSGICGQNNRSITNCYWLSGTAGAGIGGGSGTVEKVESKTEDEYKSGEVAWLLNQWPGNAEVNGKVWAVGEDGYPVLNGKSDNSVVQLTFNANTGKEEDNSIAYGNAGSALPNVTLPEITGYTFSGWYDNEALSGDAVTVIPADATGDQTYWAKWIATSSPSTPSTPPTVSEKVIAAIKAADPGETVTVDLSSGSTTLDKDVFETLAGKDVTLVVELGDGLSWTVNGTDVPADADFTDIDMGVTMGSDGIPVDLINAITGERSSVQITLAHDGAFGFTMTLTAPLGEENAGLWANLYHFSEEANAMTFETAAQIGDDGSVSLLFSHASQYAIVIDDHNHGVIDLPFTDVSEGDWFYDPVCFVYENGLMTGTSATTFEPNTHLTRAMLVAMLHRLEGSPSASGGDFTDVSDGDWYAQAVNWAASVGVVNGFDDGTFQPNAAITREQLAAILRNFAAYKGLDVSASGSLSTYTDAASVSDWAKESVEWMVGSSLIGGYEDSTLRPQGNTTRAEVASVLQRYLAN